MTSEFVLDESESLPAEYARWRSERGLYCGDPQCDPMGIWVCIPEHMRDSLAAYMLIGKQPAGFLNALLCNDLIDAVTRADDANLRSLRHYAAFLFNFSVESAHGSAAKVNTWQLIGGVLGMEAKQRNLARAIRAAS